MKILHTSDWHLGKRLGNFPRLPEQREVLDEIIELCKNEEPDLILVSGDLFDTFNPPNEAVELLYSTLKKLTRNGTCPVVALAGNHDSPERIEAPDPLARECGIFFLGYADTLPGPLVLESGLSAVFPAPGLLELTIPGAGYPVRIIYAPYANENRLRRYLGESDRDETLRRILGEKWKELADRFMDGEGVNLFAGHFFMGRRDELFTDEPEGERPILYPGGLEMIYTDNLPGNIQYAALGHLHRYQIVGESPVRVCYSGTPLAYSFSEAGQEKGVVMIEAEPGKAAVCEFRKLVSGRTVVRKKFSDSETLKTWLAENPDSLVEITLKTREYISGALKQELLESHDGIISLIPEIEEECDSGENTQADPSRSIEELFMDYFMEQNGGAAPGDELLGLFREVLSGEAAE